MITSEQRDMARSIVSSFPDNKRKEFIDRFSGLDDSKKQIVLSRLLGEKSVSEQKTPQKEPGAISRFAKNAFDYATFPERAGIEAYSGARNAFQDFATQNTPLRHITDDKTKIPIKVPNPLMPVTQIKLGETTPKGAVRELAGMGFDQLATMGAGALIKGVGKVSGGAKNIYQKYGTIAEDITDKKEELSKLYASMKSGVEAIDSQVKNTSSAFKAEAAMREAKELSGIADDIKNLEIKLQPLKGKEAGVQLAAGEKLKDRFFSLLRRKNQEYGANLNKLIGDDLEIDGERIKSSIQNALEDSGINIVVGKNDKFVIDGTATPAAQKLVKMYNDIDFKGTINLKQLLKDKQILSQKIAHGKQFGYDDTLLDDVVSRIGQRIEKEVPGIKPLNKEHSKFLSLRDDAKKTLDLFNRGINKKPREFVSRVVDGFKNNPEESRFFESLKKEIPDIEKLMQSPKALGEGIKSYDEAIALLRKSPEEAKAKIALDIESKLAELEDVRKIETVRLENSTGLKASAIESKIAELGDRQRKLRHIKNVGVGLLAGGAGVGAISYFRGKALINSVYNLIGGGS